MNKYRAAVASTGDGPVTGVIGDDIIVLPDMNSRYLPAVKNARGVVAESGGPLVHLAIVSREIGVVLMIMKKAAAYLRPGMTVILSPNRCEIVVVD